MPTYCMLRDIKTQDSQSQKYVITQAKCVLNNVDHAIRENADKKAL